MGVSQSLPLSTSTSVYVDEHLIYKIVMVDECLVPSIEKILERLKRCSYFPSLSSSDNTAKHTRMNAWNTQQLLAVIWEPTFYFTPFELNSTSPTFQNMFLQILGDFSTFNAYLSDMAHAMASYSGHTESWHIILKRIVEANSSLGTKAAHFSR